MEIFKRIEEKLKGEGYTFERVDFERPWGGFFVLNEEHKQQFITEYFEGKLSDHADINMKLSPKILIVAPDKRLSWQYHHRRSELWQVVEGTVGVVKSDDDNETEVQHYTPGQRIELAKGERHRLIGLSEYGVVAEIWIHEDRDNPSDEDDIVRLQDDFGRLTVHFRRRTFYNKRMHLSESGFTGFSRLTRFSKWDSEQYTEKESIAESRKSYNPANPDSDKVQVTEHV